MQRRKMAKARRDSGKKKKVKRMQKLNADLLERCWGKNMQA